MIEKQIIKDFVDMMEEQASVINSNAQEYSARMLYAIINSPEYQALKVSISPVSEDNKKHLEKEVIREMIRPKDAQDNDGWIEWKGGKQPVGDNVLVEIKIRGGRYLYPALSGSWNWIWINNSEDIIAYRIIEEPKEEKHEITFNSYEEYEQRIQDIRKKQEPKKQTFKEFVGTRNCFYASDVIGLVSEYLELIPEWLEQNKCK